MGSEGICGLFFAGSFIGNPNWLKNSTVLTMVCNVHFISTHILFQIWIFYQNLVALFQPNRILSFRYVGRLFFKALGKPIEIITKLNAMVGFPPNEEIDLYEVS